MNKYILTLTIALSMVAVPAFAAKNMQNDRFSDSIKNCSYFSTSSFIEERGQTSKVKFNEKIDGYVNGKCRYITEYHYSDGKARGMICYLTPNQQNLLYQSKARQANKQKKSRPSYSYESVKCESYNLINNKWVKDPRGTTLSIPR